MTMPADPATLTATTPTTTPALPSPTLDQKLTQVLKAAPELSKSPGLTVDLASASSDPTGNAQAVARSTQVISDTNSQQAVAQSTESHPSAITDALNWFSTKVVAPVAHDASVGIKDTLQAASPVLNVMNKPMQFVQHEYRYLHDVEARHGALAALGEGVFIAAGAALGTLGGGFYGGVLGAEAVTALEGQLSYNDSWQRTTDGNTYVDPNTHNPVSFGRDVVTELSHVIPQLKQGSLDFKLTSGLIDGIADMQVGGTELLGVAGEVSGASATAAAGKLGDYFGGTGVATAEDVQRAYDQYGSVRRAFQDIANKSAGEIALTPAYRPFAQQQNLLQALGRADTPEAVGQVFKDAVRANEMVFSGQVPSLAITRVPFQALHEAMGNSGIGVVQKMYKNTARIPDAWDEVSRGYSMKEFDPTSIDDGTTGIARMALFTENRQTAAAIADKYANADLPGKIQIYRNLQLSTLMNMAGFRGQSQEEYLSLFADPLMQRKVGRALDEALAGGMFGREAIYGLNDEGKNLSIVHDTESGWEYGAGILKNQTGKLQFLDLRTARHASQTLAKWAAYANGTTLEKAGASIHSMVGSIDDFAFDWATQGVFKPLVLLTPAYAMHIALAELIPNSLRLGFANMVRSGIQLNVAKIGARVEVKAAESAAADRLWAAAQDLEAKIYGGSRPTSPMQFVEPWNEKLAKTIKGNEKDYVTTPKDAHQEMVSKANQLEQRIADNVRNRNLPERDRAYGLREGVLARLNREISQRGETEGLTYQQVDEIKRFADQLGHGLFDDVRLSNISRKSAGRKAGDYNWSEGLVRLFGDGLKNPQGINRTLIHELWHHLSTYATTDELSGLQREMEVARAKFLKKNPLDKWIENNGNSLTKEDNKYIEALKSNGHLVDSKAINWKYLSQSRALFRYLGNDGYRLSSVDEWFAESMYDRTASRLSASNPLVEMGHRFMSALHAAIQRVSGRAGGEAIFRKFWNGRYEEADKASGLSVESRLTGRRGEMTSDMASSPTYDQLNEVDKLRQASLKHEANGEVSAILGLAYRLTGGDIKDATLASRYIEYLGGQFVDPAIDSGHNYSEEILSREEKSLSLMRRAAFDAPMKKGSTFAKFGVESKQHLPAWQAALKEYANDPAGQMAAHLMSQDLRAGKSLDEATQNATQTVAHYLRNLPEEQRGRMLRESSTMTPKVSMFPDGPKQGVDNFDEWAATIVQGLRGVTRGGVDRVVNTDLLDHISKGEGVALDKLDAIPEESRPSLVKGRELLPAGTSTIQRIADIGFRKALNPMVNFMSRQPIAFTEFKKQYAMLEKAVDSGVMNEDEAWVTAMNRTAYNVTRNVHNLTDRTQWTTTFRNWAPFYFAQEQAYRRMGRLLAEDPAAFRKYQLMISNMHNVGQVFTGPNGNGYLVVPGTGFLTAGVANVLSAIGVPVEGASPVGMGWNLSSSSVIFPLSDGVRVNLGPVVAIPLSAANSMFPETLSPQLKADMTVATNAILGPTANESVLTQMIPNTIVQRLVTAAEPTWNSRSFNSTMMQTLVTMYYNHQLPDPTLAVTDPMAMQSFLDRVRNQTRIMYVMKALVGAVTPVSPELTNPEYNLFTAAVAYDIKQTGSMSKGIQEFLANNPDASPFTVFQSYSPTGSVPASVQAEQWIIDNRSMLRKYPAAGLMMMPMNIDSTYNANVYNEQIAQGLRQKYTPGDTSNNDLSGYIAQLYANAGNAIVLGKWMPQYEAQINNLSGSAKYAAEQAFWGNGQPGNTPANGTLGNYAMKNPVWWDQWQKDMSGQKRGAALTEMRSLLNSPDAPKSQIADNTRNLIKGYDNYMTQLQNVSGFTSEQTQITDAWKRFLYSVVANDPTMTNVVTGLFVSIPVPISVASNVPYSATSGQFTAQSWNQAG